MQFWEGHEQHGILLARSSETLQEIEDSVLRLGDRRGSRGLGDLGDLWGDIFGGSKVGKVGGWGLDDISW